ncbi:MAG: major capsid protein [Methylobacter sp.]|nr:major capsid protein [Methylobacter sp.]
MKIFKNRFAQIAGVSAVSIGVASAAVPAVVTTALSDAGTDSLTMGAAVLVVIVGIYALKLLRRAL